MARFSKKGEGNIGCIVILAIILLCVVVTWARENPRPTAGIVCSIIAIWIAWNLWKKLRLSQAKRKEFEARFGVMLEKFEKDVEIVEESFKQAKAAADSVDRGLAEVERKQRSFS